MKGIGTFIIILIITIILAYFLNPFAAIYLGIILLVHFVTSQILSEEQGDKFEMELHKVVIKLPDCIKCAVQVNRDAGYCYNQEALDNYKSQQNADIDGFALAHFLNWMIVGLLFGLNIPVWKIVLISLAWEGYEVGGDAARFTDPIVNTLGFIIGKLIRQAIYPKIYFNLSKQRDIRYDYKKLKNKYFC